MGCTRNGTLKISPCFKITQNFLHQLYAYVRCPEVLAPGANRICLARPKDMRARGTIFYCIFERIELNCIGHENRGRPAKHLGT